MGGTDEPSNLIELSVEEHALTHLALYNKFGKKEDLGAYHLLSKGYWDEETVKIRNSIAGTNSQRKRKPEENSIHLIKARASVAADSIANPEKYIKKAKEAGKKTKETVTRKMLEGSYNNSGWFSSERGQEMAAKNNAISTCPHCNKQGQYRAMKRWHFDKCKHI